MWQVRLGIVLVVAAAAFAAPHRHRLHRQTSIVVHGMAEGPDGRLWLAARDGLYTFSGLHFQKEIDRPTDALRFVGFTSDGSLWLGGRDGLLRRRGNAWETLVSGDIAAMAVVGSRVLIKTETLLEVDESGGVRSFEDTPRGDLLPDAAGDVYFVGGDLRVHRYSRQLRRVEPLAALGGYLHVLPAPGGGYWAAYDRRADLVDGGTVLLRLSRGVAPGGLRTG
ncbi:MAG TPA: hypothetical protein DEH78_31660, partial [Solibacterales bacterium]|nr:hypothetical protein [Bryobacterales bacterium]